MDVAERLTLEASASNSLEAIEHIHRYMLAAELCSGARVLDLCCGSGYGSRILREVCPSVVGIDKDVGTIDMARAMIGRETDVEFEAADAHDVLSRSLPDHFDAIVLFEGLEHLANPEKAIAALQRHAEAGLKLVVSIPNSKTFGEENPFHVVNYGYEDAVEVGSRFDHATILYQFVAEGSVIRSETPAELEVRFVEIERGELEYANHFVLCVNCGSKESGLTSPRLQLTATPAHTRYMRNLELGNAELRRANARLGRERLGVADSAAASILARIERLTRELEELRVRIDEEEQAAEAKRAHDEWIENLHEQIEEHKRTIRDMETTRIWRLGGRYWAARDRLRRSFHAVRR
jgi:2-polyprenyl-3-methyl-5-hydroxy-6-metoxy-1,4-benzoquinol methylase